MRLAFRAASAGRLTRQCLFHSKADRVDLSPYPPEVVVVAPKDPEQHPAGDDRPEMFFSVRRQYHFKVPQPPAECFVLLVPSQIRPDAYSYQLPLPPYALERQLEVISPKEAMESYESMDPKKRKALSEPIRLLFFSKLHPKRYLSYEERTEFSTEMVRKWDGEKCLVDCIQLQAWRRLVRTYRRRLEYMLETMREDGVRLTSESYVTYLQIAVATKDRRLAFRAWQEMIRDGIRPNVHHYQCLLALAVGGYGNEGLHMTVEKRRARKGSEKIDLRGRLLAILRRMEDDRIEPNTRTAELMVLAYARMGDVAGVEELLERIWGLRMNPKPEIKPLELPGVIRPKDTTIFAVINAFGMNGEIRKASIAAELLASHYQIKLTRRDSDLLLNWTYQICGAEMKEKADKMKSYVIPRLFEALKAPPYNNTTPSMDAFDMLIRSHIYASRPSRAMAAVRECLQQNKIPLGFLIPSSMIFTAQEYRDSRHAMQVRRWLELIILHGSRALARTKPNFSLREVPGFIEEFKDAFAATIPYEVPGGFVQLHTGIDDWIVKGAVRGKNLYQASRWRWMRAESYRYGAEGVDYIGWVNDEL